MKPRKNEVVGRIYRPTGELYFEGIYNSQEFYPNEPWRPLYLYEGKVYYMSGVVKSEGIFQLAGLLIGRKYYPSGKLWFEGVCNDKTNGHPSGSYYGPSYPIYGRFYDEDGNLIFEGKPRKSTTGSLGYPVILEPEGFKLDWK